MTQDQIGPHEPTGSAPHDVHAIPYGASETLTMNWFSLARCGKEAVKSMTADAGLVTCAGCAAVSRERALTELAYVRGTIRRIGRALAALDHEDNLPAAIVEALDSVESQIDTVQLRLSVDGLVEGVSDG